MIMESKILIIILIMVIVIIIAIIIAMPTKITLKSRKRYWDII